MLIASLLIVGTGLVGWLIAGRDAPPAEVSLITLTAEQAGDVVPTFRTSNIEQAERFVRDRLGWRLTVPSITEANLSGVAIREIVPGAEVPILLYREERGAWRVAVYVVNYALLDRFEGRIRLEADILRQIQDTRHFDLHDLGDSKALVWRHRNDIFVAITAADAEALRGRIVYR
jgi:catechol 2,3-dioxygenase-like lactoylglutathione lyase family enzyme